MKKRNNAKAVLTGLSILMIIFLVAMLTLSVLHFPQHPLKPSQCSPAAHSRPIRKVHCMQI